jgi:hypothetical protein
MRTPKTTSLAALLFVGALYAGEIETTPVAIPGYFSVQVPSNWVPRRDISSRYNALYQAGDQNYCGSILIKLMEPPLSLEKYRLLTDEHLKAYADENPEAAARTIKKEAINGIPAIVQYRTTAWSHGQTIDLFIREKQFRIVLIYLRNKPPVWKTIIQNIRESIRPDGEERATLQADVGKEITL